MEKAFDIISRHIVHRPLPILSLPPDVFTMIHAWLAPNQYYIPFKDLVGHLTATRGNTTALKSGPLVVVPVYAFIDGRLIGTIFPHMAP